MAVEKDIYHSREEFSFKLQQAIANPSAFKSEIIVHKTLSEAEKSLKEEEVNAVFGERVFPFRFFTQSDFARAVTMSRPDPENINLDGYGDYAASRDVVFANNEGNISASVGVYLQPFNYSDICNFLGSTERPLIASPYEDLRTLPIILDENGKGRFTKPLAVLSVYPYSVSYSLISSYKNEDRNAAESPWLQRLYELKFGEILGEFPGENEGFNAWLEETVKSPNPIGTIGNDLHIALSVGKSEYRWRPKSSELRFGGEEQLIECLIEDHTVIMPDGTEAEEFEHFLIPLDSRLYDISLTATVSSEE